MKWVLQTNVYSEEGYDGLVEAISRLELPRCTVKVIPFGGGLEVVEGWLPAPGQRAIVMGSYTLARVAREQGWSPGAFLDNLDFQTQHAKWGEHMLNYDAIVDHMYGVPMHFHKFLRPITGPFFIRPVDDSKAFTGMVMDPVEFEEWFARLAKLEAEGLSDSGGSLNTMTKVMLCSKKELWSETRTWVVGGRVVTWSGYKVGTIKRYLAPDLVDPKIVEFAQEMAYIYCPNDAFVLDIAETIEGMKIVEVNNLNSAGFYKGDMNKLIMALEHLDALVHRTP